MTNSTEVQCLLVDPPADAITVASHPPPPLFTQTKNSAGEANIRPKVKGFLFNHRARDPTLARAVSAPVEAIKISENILRVPAGTFPGTDSVTSQTNCGIESSPSLTAIDESMSVGKKDQNTLHSDAVDTRKEQEIFHANIRTREHATNILPNAAEEASIRERNTRGTKEGNAPCVGAAASASEETAAAEEMDFSPGESVVVLPASRSKQVMMAAPAASVKSTEVRNEGGATIVLQHPNACKRKPSSSESHEEVVHKLLLPPDYVAPGGTAVPNDAFLSHRSKVRAVVFSRPHKHQPRKRRGRQAQEVELPGPGDYNVTGERVGWQRERVAPVVAPTRYCQLQLTVPKQANAPCLTCESVVWGMILYE